MSKISQWNLFSTRLPSTPPSFIFPPPSPTEDNKKNQLLQMNSSVVPQKCQHLIKPQQKRISEDSPAWAALAWGGFCCQGGQALQPKCNSRNELNLNEPNLAKKRATLGCKKKESDVGENSRERGEKRSHSIEILGYLAKC